MVSAGSFALCSRRRVVVAVGPGKAKSLASAVLAVFVRRVFAIFAAAELDGSGASRISPLYAREQMGAVIIYDGTRYWLAYVDRANRSSIGSRARFIRSCR